MVVGSSCGRSVQGLRLSGLVSLPPTMKLNMKQSWSANDERIARYLVRVPEEEKQAHISEYRLPRSFGYLKYLNDSDAQYVLVELHEGRYYWPIMRQDVENYVKSCDRCQRYTLIPRMPSEVFNPVTSP
ncbi:hypothetical protein AAG906_000111 [Vitis piasezkii]